MIFNLLINPTHNWQESNQHAMKLARSMLNQGHLIQSVFFYGDSAQIAIHVNSQLAWTELTQDLPTAFLICRTMIESNSLKPQLQTGFSAVGMAQLASDMIISDKTIEVV